MVYSVKKHLLIYSLIVGVCLFLNEGGLEAKYATECAEEIEKDIRLCIKPLRTFVVPILKTLVALLLTF